jgi:hypothetical protein
MGNTFGFWFSAILVCGFVLIYNMPVIMFFWLFYDDNRILTVKKAQKIKQHSCTLLGANIVLYFPYLYVYNISIIGTKLPAIWPTIIPIIVSWVNIKLSNNLLNKAKENIEQ